MLTHYERLKTALDTYKNLVEQSTKTLKRNFLIKVGFILGIVILTIIAYFFSNFAGFLTALGLGGLNAWANAKDWIESTTIYFRNKDKLLGTVSKLELELQLCDHNDDQCLNKVEKLLRDYMNKLTA